MGKIQKAPRTFPQKRFSKKSPSTLKSRIIFVFCCLVFVFLCGLFGHYYYFGKFPHFFAWDLSDLKLRSFVAQDLHTLWKNILIWLSQKDFSSLSEYLADDGVDFLPYPYEKNLDRIQTIKKEGKSDFSSLSSSNEVLTRGVRDGSGEPLSMTFDEYYERFIRDENYLQAPESFENEQVQSRGNTMVNLSTLYPWSQIIEYHFTGFNEEFAGMDWKSLYLVFIPSDWENLKLRAIAHGEWTI